MRRVEGKIAMVTGAARGQGRSHALTLAREGADIVAVDICEQIESVKYPMSTQADLDETARLIEEQDQRCLPIKADARSLTQMQAATDAALVEFGRIDILVVNHGINHISGWETVTEEEWDDSLATNLSGVWRSTRPVIPSMVVNGGGAIVFTSSVAGLCAAYGLGPYVAAKHAVIGLMKSLSAELGQHEIRVNAVCPGFVLSGMTNNDSFFSAMSGGKEGATLEDTVFPSLSMNLLQTPWMDPQEISNAVLFLVSDEGRYITGVALPVDFGILNQPPGLGPVASRKVAELEDQIAALDAAST